MTARAKNSASPEPGSSQARPVRRLPPLKALQAFEAASRCGSFAQGADELHVTPSAVSHQIQILEGFLGVKLFQRHAGRAVLTNAGGIYAREIGKVFGGIAEATRLVSSQPRSGRLVIASGPSFAAKWLQPRLPEFLRAHPDVKVRLTTLADCDDLDAGNFDVAIAYGQSPRTQNEQKPLLVERLRPMCAPALASALRLRTPRDLERATLIHSKNALTWSDYLQRTDFADVCAADELWLDRSAMAIEAAVAGLGVILESEILSEREMADGRLIAPFDDATCSVEVASYFLVRPKRTSRGVPYAAFEDWLRDALATANLALPTIPTFRFQAGL